MFEFMRFRKEIKALQQQECMLAEKYRSVKKEEDEIHHYILFRQSQHYKNICDQYALPMPDITIEDNYIKYNFDDGYGERHILTKKGMHETRKLIREEKRSKREEIGYWFTMLTGLIGVVIGLISVIGGK